MITKLNYALATRLARRYRGPHTNAVIYRIAPGEYGVQITDRHTDQIIANLDDWETE